MQHIAVGDYRVPILSRKFLVGFPKISLAGLRVAWLRPGSLDRPPPELTTPLNSRVLARAVAVSQ